jgi:TRAP-type uncharacterized transport system substrate-binding protein
VAKAYPRIIFNWVQSVFKEAFGLGPAAALSTLLLLCLSVVAGTFLFFYLAPPRTITLSAGPKGSVFERYAERYRQILKQNGIILKILSSEGSVENIRRLADPSLKVDVGFVQGGVLKGVQTDKLVSLGSISYQPLLVFYRSNVNFDRLSQFSGKRVAIGNVGSGTHTLSRALLAVNGIEPGGATTLLEMDSDEAAKAILDGTVDSVFLMGDSVSMQLIRQLLHTPGVNLFDFTQADGYVRRMVYLNKVVLPKGSIDFGKGTPKEDISLVAPTIELIARENLHPALSDLLLDAARQVHSGPGLFRRRGEFPAPIEQEIRISADADRFYKSGKSFFYRYLPFWLASFVNRIVVVLVPIIILLLPGLRAIPAIYRWRFKSRLFRWYRQLISIERSLLTQTEPEQHKELLRSLDAIEEAVNRMKVPASFADQFYVLRGHISFVRGKMAC